MEIRNIVESDLDAVSVVCMNAMNPIYGEISLEENKRIVVNMFKLCDKNLSLLAEDEGKIIGYFFTKIHVEPWDEFPYVISFAVEPEYQSKGIGSMLMNKTIEILKEKNFKSLKFHVLPTNEKALNFYKKMGFEIEKVLMGKEF